MQELCMFFNVNVTIVFIHATYNNIQNGIHVEITYVFDTCKIQKIIITIIFYE